MVSGVSGEGEGKTSLPVTVVPSVCVVVASVDTAAGFVTGMSLITVVVSARLKVSMFSLNVVIVMSVSVVVSTEELVVTAPLILSPVWVVLALVLRVIVDGSSVATVLLLSNEEAAAVMSSGTEFVGDVPSESVLVVVVVVSCSMELSSSGVVVPPVGMGVSRTVVASSELVREVISLSESEKTASATVARVMSSIVSS